MEGIRGFNKDMTATLGKGIYQYGERGTYTEPECKARSNGFHFVEYAPDCLSYYGLGLGNRFFLIEASGDINEEAGGVCSCTTMTIKKELTLLQFTIKTLEYMVKNPRMDWERARYMLEIKRNQARADLPGAIAIARGTVPRVSGVKGSVLGLVLENNKGEILAAKAWEAGDSKTYTLRRDYELEEVK